MLLSIDYETYYAVDYRMGSGGLKRTEYLNDPRFKVHGAAVSIDFGGSTWITADRLPEFFGDMGPHISHMLAFNGLFDHAITAMHYFDREVFLLDPMSMAQAVLSTRYPHLSMSLAVLAKYLFPDDPSRHKYEGWLAEAKGVRDLPDSVERNIGVYACQDNKVANHVFHALINYQFPWDTALADIHLTLAMGVYPKLCMDRQRAAAINEYEVTLKEQAVAALQLDRADLRSGKKFAALLAEHGVAPPMKTNAKGEPTYAFAKTDEGMQALLEHENPAVALLAEIRLGEKASQKETRAAAFARLPERLPVPLRFAAAHTGRHGGEEFNMQNLERGSDLRACVRAPAGHKIVVRDLSQIELRMGAWWCGEQWLLDLLQGGGDPYCALASRIYGREITKADADERYVGKQGELSCLYQVGHDRLFAMMKQKGVRWADLDLARKVKTSFRTTHPAFVDTWKWLQQKALPVIAGFGDPFEHKGVKFRFGHVVLPSGRQIWYPELHVNENGDWVYRVNKKRNKGADHKKIFGGAFLENIIQAMSYDVFMHHMRTAWRAGHRAAMAVHDEMVFVVPEGDAEAVSEAVAAIQARAPDWCSGIPLASEGGHGDNYLEAK